MLVASDDCPVGGLRESAGAAAGVRLLEPGRPGQRDSHAVLLGRPVLHADRAAAAGAGRDAAHWCAAMHRLHKFHMTFIDTLGDNPSCSAKPPLPWLDGLLPTGACLLHDWRTGVMRPREKRAFDCNNLYKGI